MDIAPYIRELVLLNECVILPDFGGFETQYAAAQYDSRRKKMLPPTKKVHFRPDFVKGGDVIKDHLCKRLNLTEDKAVQAIVDYVSDLKSQIEENREAIIEGVGLFTKGLGNSISFTPFEDENYLAESFGLDALQVELENPQTTKIKEKKELRINPRNNTLLMVIVGILTICFLLGITILISSRFDLYLFNLGDKSVQDELIILGNTAPGDSIQQKIDLRLVESTNIKAALSYNESESDPAVQSKDKYFLVAGSFKSIGNAESLEKELLDNGYMPLIIENSGYYRVTIGNYVNRQEALLELKRLRRQLNRSVWLLTIESN